MPIVMALFTSMKVPNAPAMMTCSISSSVNPSAITSAWIPSANGGLGQLQFTHILLRDRNGFLPWAFGKDKLGRAIVIAHQWMCAHFPTSIQNIIQTELRNHIQQARAADTDRRFTADRLDLQSFR